MAEGKKTTIDAGLVDLVARGLSYTIQGVTGSTWFGPNQPLAPIAPKDQGIRQFDYPVGFNLYTQPRITESGISYAQLRALADGYDLLRIVIETRKDQVAAQPSTFRLRREDGENDKKYNQRTLTDPRVKALNSLFRYPDGEHDWKTWVRALLEEVFVIDALSLAPKWAMDGKSILGLDVIDGSTIVRKIDADGRTPLPTSPAYQQILKGVPAKDLTTRDLMYKPRNYRAHRVYGYSPVEQIVITVNMALRRQGTQLYHFTEGNVPEALAQVPDTWTPGDIQTLQDMFDTMAGNVVKRSRIRFLPKLEGILFPKEKLLLDEFDTWLARIVCFCFSISSQPFIKQMNRATAETAEETAKEEGLIPILDFISGTLTMFVERYMGYDDIEHTYLDDEEADRYKQAQIDEIYLKLGKVGIDEVRERDGEEPIGIGPMMLSATGPVPLVPFLDGGPMAEGLPSHAKSPEELDAEKEQGRQDTFALAGAKAGERVPPGGKGKEKPVKKKIY